MRKIRLKANDQIVYRPGPKGTLSIVRCVDPTLRDMLGVFLTIGGWQPEHETVVGSWPCPDLSETGARAVVKMLVDMNGLKLAACEVDDAGDWVFLIGHAGIMDRPHIAG